MPASPDDIARRTAQKLVDLDPDLPAHVEARLQGGETAQRYEPVTAIAVASLIVSAAKLAWDIYTGLKKTEPASPPSPDVVTRRVRLEVEVAGGLTADQESRIIAVAVEEAMREADRSR